MDRRSRFVYGSTTFEPRWPAKAWTPIDESVGGQRLSAAGIPASYLVRRDVLLELRLRIEEDEWPDLLNLVLYGQTAQSLTWFPDLNDAASFDVYLHEPAAGDRWSPTRDASYPKLFEARLVLRGVSGALPWTEYFST